MVFDLSALAVGDVVEFYYEGLFNTTYRANVFYFYGNYPKLKCELDFVYRIDKSYKDVRFVVPFHSDSTKVYSSKVDY